MARILIVDDDLNNVEMLFIAATILGHEPIGAYSGQQAIDAVAYKKPDLVLLDYLMPGQDGVETLRQIRALPNGRLAQIYIYSGVDNREIEEQLKDEGADGILIKPMDLNKLEALLNNSIPIDENIEER
jgi:CheY-like chemotaxis protein